ncbi:E3 ubiquitin-protein ligase BRE1-like 1 isoform X1 [Phoenix dactylifera]|uniref:E3 ubiquitin protein ligase n=1 Tax=Phoenix dactylifera TaxID=42345 RepID=A0A8B7CPV8_PHODC|nr:E3 ubiquitin-protein ligase BRE1-like 1 isoform X1 [Phoenix dactylifera]
MGSTGEPDRKRRHFSSISPTAAAAAMKQPLAPCSDDKKLDVAVLQYKNQKLVEQLEAQKVECLALDNKLTQLKEKHKNYRDTLLVVNNSWERLVGDLESLSVCTSGSTNDGYDLRHSHMIEDGASCPTEDDFLSRLLETGATESSNYVSPSEKEDDIGAMQLRAKNILQNIIASFNDVCHVNEELAAALLVALPEDENSRQLMKTTNDLEVELGNFLVALGDLHLKHRLLTDRFQNHQDADAKNKAEHNRLAEELASTVAELEESNRKLATLKAQRDTTQGTPFLFPTLGNKHVGGDKVRDKQKELHDLESTVKESMNLVSSRLVEIRSLHEERIEILKKLVNLQNTLMDIKSISSSKAFQLLNDQLEKSNMEMDQYRASLEKLQVEKDNFVWHEKEMTLKVDLAEISWRVSVFSESRTAELDQELQRLAEERIVLETKLEEALREPGRKKIIAEFKALVSSLPKDMGIMQSELSKCKEAASELHSFRAEVQSLSSMLQRKEAELESISDRYANQLSEVKKLQSTVRDLRQANQELKLFLEMYRRESTDSREVIESRDMEYKSWALVQSLKSSLDEHNLEHRVKAANEAEAISQQRLATAEAKIAELRQKLEDSGREICKYSETLKSKHEEGEAYLSEIESIGQAYEDMQTQNQHLLQQITERDDYNIKLVIEGVKARQLNDALRTEIQVMDKKLQQANSVMVLYSLEVGHLDEQLKVWSEHVGKLAEDGRQNSIIWENAQRRLLDGWSESQQIRQSLDEIQSKAGASRLDVTELLIELEKERFNTKRLEEDLEVMSRKAEHLRAQTEGYSVLEKLRQEVREYRGILKCSICLDRQKEVVIAKCYHLFCNQCIQRTLGNRQRRCPTCGMSFGPNDVKPIYI